MQASQISSQEVCTRSMFEVRRLNMNKPHSDATTTRQTATHGPRQAITPDNVQMTLPANQSESNIASRTRTHTCYAIYSSNVSEALGRTCLPVAHGPTVYAHQSVSDTGTSRIIARQRQTSRTCCLIMFRSLFSNRQQRLRALNL